MLPSESPAAEPPADDPASWAQFLGPRRDGISRETGLLTDWSKKKPKVLWTAPLGFGFSSVAIAEDRLYSMAKRGNRDIVVGLDLQSGKELWAYDAAPSYLDRQRQGPGPRATPTYHKGKLWCLLPLGELICLSAGDGKELWKTDIFQVSGAKSRIGDTYYWGMSGSPLVEDDLVIVQPGGNKNNSLVAFRKDTGKMAWGTGSDPAGYSSPIAITAAGRRQIVSVTGQSVLGVDPVKGDLLWRYTIGNKFDCSCATPLWADNLLFVSAAYGAGCAALEIVAGGEGVTVKEKWRNKNLQNQFTTSVILDGHIYGCHGDLGAVMLRCLSLATGVVKWESRKPGKCSLLAFEGHILCANEGGKLLLIEANPKEYVEKGELDGLLTYKTWPAPALLNKRLYVRDQKQLVCLDLRKE